MGDPTHETPVLLVVDDNPGDVRFIEEAFAGADLDVAVRSATTREAALEHLHGRGESADAAEPDALLLDWHLSTGTGREVLAAAKALDASLPVVVMTGSKAELPAVDAAGPEADRVVEKRTDPEGYVEIVRSLLAVG